MSVCKIDKNCALISSYRRGSFPLEKRADVELGHGILIMMVLNCIEMLKPSGRFFSSIISIKLQNNYVYRASSFFSRNGKKANSPEKLRNDINQTNGNVKPY